MTQPQPDDGNGQVIAAAAIGLALIAIETQVRDDITSIVNALSRGLAAATLLAAASAAVATGLALISLASFHTALTSLFDTARRKTRDIITTGYTAATHVAASHLDELHTLDRLPDLGTTDSILRDVDTMFGHAQTAFQNLVAEHYDPRDPDRLAKIQDLTDQAAAGLRQRATASGTTAVHRGSTDTQQAIFTDYQNTTGTPGLMKRWRTTSATPCGMCEALDGTLVGVNAEFDHTATTVEQDLRPVWRNLSGPPRHPNCRCQIELVAT